MYMASRFQATTTTSHRSDHLYVQCEGAHIELYSNGCTYIYYYKIPRMNVVATIIHNNMEESRSSFPQ
jgi:hypothetical protein